MVANPEDRFSRDETQIFAMSLSTYLPPDNTCLDILEYYKTNRYEECE